MFTPIFTHLGAELWKTVFSASLQNNSWEQLLKTTYEKMSVD
jgi:hypothetical protein